MSKASAPRPADNVNLWEIVQGTAAETGEQFFDQLVKHLARAIGTKSAWVTEWLDEPRRLRALSFWVGDSYVRDYEYDVAKTACKDVLEGKKLIHVPDRVLELYPDDPDLAPLGAVSYMGIPLLDTDGRALGHLAVLHDAPLPEDQRIIAVFNIFAGRAAAELRRVHRDRDLREREEKLSRLIDSAMDAIIELQEDLSVSHLNRAAEEMFGCKAADVVGTTLDSLFTEASRGKLAYLVTELQRRRSDKQSLWIPDGIRGKRLDEGSFPAEASLSSFELHGRPRYTLILRNINDRLEAEDRIRSLLNETAYLRAEIESLGRFSEIVGRSSALKRTLADVEQVAKSDSTVLIMGETGTGKELIARAIHQRSARRDKPLIKVNCAAIPANLQESEFFGHTRGAFTGATRHRDGRFKLADGGTIFLDEVGELPMDLQAKLLRVVQEGEFEPVGSSTTMRVDVRVIAATNRDLERMVEEGMFREDLFYRLNVFPIRSPPLRERGGDVVLLAEQFALDFGRRSGREVAPLTDECKAKLRAYDWPGNVRELQNVIERAVITSHDGRTLNLNRALPDSASHSTSASAQSKTGKDERILTAQEIQDFERQNMIRALEAADWKIAGTGNAAERLGLHPNTLASRMKSLGIERPRRR